MEKKRTYGVWAVRSSTSIFGPAQSWCKENGKPLEFDTKAAAENYAKEANEHTTANVRYYVKEKEPEPGAVRKGTSQPELDARSHEEVIPRNDAAEKQNEIPGRQIPSQTDPLVEIRSAVHSNYAGTQDMIVEVPDEVALLLREYMLLEEAYRIRTYRYKAFYSLDRDEGIEREILQKPLNPAEIWEQRQMTELIYKGLSKLPVKQRQRIYAHFFLGMSKADIAKAEGTHKSRITRSIEAGLRSLEKYFKEIL